MTLAKVVLLHAEYHARCSQLMTARRVKEEPAQVTLDSAGHEMYNTTGVGGACKPHDYHFI